jgi:hypothetical protein
MAHDDDDFYGGLQLGAKTASSLDVYLQDRESQLASAGLRSLTDKGREANAFQLPAEVGVRVSFITNIGSVLQWKDPPADGSEGTVVMVRTAEGDQTSLNGMVFVKFDTGEFLQVDPEFLRRANPNTKLASSFTRRVGNLGDLSGFLRWGSDDDELVHKATRDLWSFETTDGGDYVISRLFDDTGEPLRV